MNSPEGLLSFFFYLYTNLGYLGIFLLFIVITCIPMPLPEEIVLLAIGYAAAGGIFKAKFAFLVALAGGFLTDFGLYLFARAWGRRWLFKKPLKYLFKEKRVLKAEAMVERYGILAVALGRFVWGMRAQIFMACGIFKFHMGKFLITDFLACSFVVSTFIFLGYTFKGDLDQLSTYISTYKNTSMVLGGISFGIFGYLFIKKFLKALKEDRLEGS